MDVDPKSQPIYDALSPRKRAASFALGGTEDSLQRPRIRGLAGGDPDLELQRAPTTFGLSERRAWCGVALEKFLADLVVVLAVVDGSCRPVPIHGPDVR